METFFKIENMVCGYADHFNLEKINFELPKGSLAGIIGPNGSGKTTLFKGISGDLRLKSGKVILDKTNLSELPLRKFAQNVAVVSQNTEITDITVEDYVLLGRIPYRSNFHFFETKNDIDIAHKYMKLTDVYQFKNKYLTELSGGEQQLAAIARALTQEPQLLLLDEPTSHLDITHQVQVLNLIQNLNRKLNLTVLIIIHDLNLAGEYCDYLVMMNHGKVHIQGTPSTVLNYQTIEEVYNTVVITRENPVSKRPVVFLVSERLMNEMGQE
jgi:iron complex transport system ATP-binding protein